MDFQLLGVSTPNHIVGGSVVIVINNSQITNIIFSFSLGVLFFQMAAKF